MRALHVDIVPNKKIKRDLEKALANSEASEKAIATVRTLIDNESFLTDLSESIGLCFAQKEQKESEPNRAQMEKTMWGILKSTGSLLEQLHGLDNAILEHYTLTCIRNPRHRNNAGLPFSLPGDLAAFASTIGITLSRMGKREIRKRTKAWQYDLAGNIARILMKHGVKPAITRGGVWYLLTSAFTEQEDTQNLLRTVQRTPAFQVLLKKA